jgi:hypothetical protein
MKRWLVKSVETLDQKVGCVNGGSARLEDTVRNLRQGKAVLVDAATGY